MKVDQLVQEAMTTTRSASRGTVEGQTNFMETGIARAATTILSDSKVVADTKATISTYEGEGNAGLKPSNRAAKKASTTTTLISTRQKKAIVFVAMVTLRNGGTPLGTVTFSDGPNELAVVRLNERRAEFIATKLTSRTHKITATYNGNANFSGSSASLTEVVDRK